MGLTRRAVLTAGVLGAAGLAAATMTTSALAADPGNCQMWSALYGATPAGPVTITGHVILDVDATADSVHIAAGGSLEFLSSSAVTLRSRGNVVVEGVLRMRPSGANVHRLTFIEVNEAAFVGGGTDVLASDVGLWVTGHGVLDAQGQPRSGWNRTGTDATWQAGDEIRLAPHAAGDYRTFAPFTPGSAIPSISLPDGSSLPAEVLNLTRTVVIGGTVTGRAHVMFLGHSHDGGPQVSAPQTIRHVRFEHVGPRQIDPAQTNKTTLVPGRYGLHFHHCGDGTRGTLVEGVVVAECGTRGFVAHASHGITFKDCIAYSVAVNGYWWDRDPESVQVPVNSSHDVRYERCAAFGIGEERATDQYRSSGFELGSGTGIAAVQCVAVGAGRALKGDTQPSGFHWPGGIKDPHFWEFTDCVAHNNEGGGILSWQNDTTDFPRHLITGFIGYRNEQSGIDHGAYVSAYDYVGGALLDNRGKGQLIIHAQSKTTFSGLTIDATGQGCAIYIPNHSTSAKTARNTVADVRMIVPSGPAVVIEEDTRSSRTDFVSCLVNGSDLEPSNFLVASMADATVIRVQRRDRTAFQVHPNGSSSAIPAFA